MSFMTGYMKQLSFATLAVLVSVLAGCGGSDESNAVTESPLWCKSPETINEIGNACELVITPCNYPEVANADTQLCEMSKEAWIDGSNGITMPVPAYTPAANELVIYFQFETPTDGSAIDYNLAGLHAWNNADCNSYADFDRPEGTTPWGSSLAWTGIDDNFGAYWVMNTIDPPNCINFIVYDAIGSVKFSGEDDILVDISTVNTGELFLLEKETTIFPFPRTFASLVVPGGSTPAPLECEAPLIANEAGDECVTDPNAVPTIVDGAAELYLRGLIDWETTDDSNKFVYSKGVYTMALAVTGSATAYDFKVADADWNVINAFGASEGDETVVLGESKTLIASEELGKNISLTIPNNGNYQFILDISDTEAPTLTVIEVAYDKVLYVKGDMNEWANALPMVYKGENIYTSLHPLEMQDYAFKVADANWTDATNFGIATEGAVVPLDTATTLVFGEDVAQNINFTAAAAGTYRFILDATNKGAPILTIENAVPYSGRTLYLKGDMNDWSTTPNFDFALTDTTYVVNALIDNTKKYGFKIASDGWENDSTMGAFAGEGDVVIGEEKLLTLPGEDNIAIEVTENKILTFTLDATDFTAPKLTVTEAPAPYQERTMYLKGDMNGWATEEAYILTYAAGIYTIETLLPVRSYNFKIASADWEEDSTVGGVVDDNILTAGEAKTLTLPGADITFDVTKEATYVFTLNAINPLRPMLTITEKTN
jgi:hypothetical protein